MSNRIKSLTGRYLYLEMPPIPKKKIIVDENTKDALQKAMLKELNRLKIFAKGALVSEQFVVGDSVLVDPSVLANPNTSIIPLENNEGVTVQVILVQDYQIIHIWEND